MSLAQQHAPKSAPTGFSNLCSSRLFAPAGEATPTESIDFSGKRLGVASAIIIASCIGGNEHLKQLKCAARHPYCI